LKIKREKMARATTGRIHLKRRKRILKDAKGFYGAEANFSEQPKMPEGELFKTPISTGE
jgi:hypothetical protein